MTINKIKFVNQYIVYFMITRKTCIVNISTD